MKKWIYIITGAVVLAIVAVVLQNYIWNSSETQATNIDTAVVSRRDLGSTVFALGVIEPKVGAEVRVGSRVSGVVERLRANIGDYVEAGDLIAEIDEEELRARLEQNIAALEKAKADYEYAVINYERQKALLEKNFVSQQQVDVAENAVKSSLAQLRQAEANVEFAKIQLSYTKIRASISGIVASVSTQEGETVAASFAAPTFVNLIDLERLEVHTYVDETDIGDVNVGQKASFTVDTYRGIEFPGKVTAIYPKAVIQDNVVNYIVTVDILDFQDKILRPEMTANVTIYLDTREDVLTAPTAAIQRDRGDRFVTVLDGDKRVKRTINVGIQDGAYTEVTSGLSEGEVILVSE